MLRTGFNPARSRRVLVLGVVAVLLVAAGSVAALWLRGGDERRVTAYFERATGLYPGSEVRILGVEVGRVTKITPRGDKVEVEMAYEAGRKIPADAQAVIVVPSLVADRYVQFTPVYKSGDVLADGATLSTDRTAVPVELDDATKAVNDLSKALGPDGANKEGALSRLLSSGATALDGQGGNLRQTLKDVSSLSTVLAENTGNTSETIRNLDTVTQAMAASDKQIRSFNRSLATVSGQLAADKTELRAAITALGSALQQISTFVKNNKKDITTSVTGLAQITGSLVKQKAALETFLDKAPVGAGNASLLYDGQSGSLHTRMNLRQGDNLAMWLCSLTYSVGAPPKQCEQLLKPLNALGVPLTKLGADLSWVTALTTQYDIVPPPPDAYKNGKPRNKNNDDLGGILLPPR